MFKKTTLPNGLRIITAPMSGTNTATALVLCATGSDHEAFEQGGISHFLEHMFFKGTKERPSPRVVAEELDGMGAMYNAFTSHEYTGYYVKTGKLHTERALNVLADIYRNSLLKGAEVEKEKQVIVEELHRDLDTPTQYIWWVWEHLLYGEHPAGRDVIGSEATIRSFKEADLREYFMHQYAAPNTTVVLAGNFDEAQMLGLIKQYFGDIRAGAPARTKPDFEDTAQETPAFHHQEKATDQTHIAFGFRGVAADDPRRYAADVLATILGGGSSSRMWLSIRDGLGLAYSVATAHEAYSNRGYLVTYAGVDHTNVTKAVGAMRDEYRRIRDQGVSEDELRRVKDYIRGTTLIALESSSAVANFIGVEEAVTGAPLTIDEVFANMEAVTPESLERIAAELLKPDRMNLALLGPAQDASPIRAASAFD